MKQPWERIVVVLGVALIALLAVSCFRFFQGDHVDWGHTALSFLGLLSVLVGVVAWARARERHRGQQK